MKIHTPLPRQSYRFSFRRLLLALSSIGLLALSQSSVAAPNWAQSYGFGSYNQNMERTNDNHAGSGVDFATSIAQMPDGGVVVAGQVDLPALRSSGDAIQSQGGLVRYAADGTIIWQQMMKLNRPLDHDPRIHAGSYISTVKTDTAGNIFVAGGKGVTNGHGMSGKPFVAKFNAKGELLWQNGLDKGVFTYPPPPDSPPGTESTVVDGGASPFESIHLTPDGGVVAITSHNPLTDERTVPGLMKFGPNGNLQMHAAYRTPEGVGELDTHAPAVCASKDGKRYVFLARWDSTGFDAIQTNAAGDIIRMRRFGTTQDGLNSWDEPLAIIPTDDGNYAMLSAVLARGFGEWFQAHIVVRKVDADLNPIFEKQIEPIQANTRFSAKTLQETTDGGFLIGGYFVGYGTGASDAALMKLTPNGAINFVSLLGGPSYEGSNGAGYNSGVSAVQVKGGGYAFATSTLSYRTDEAAKTDWWVARTDANRRVQHFADVMVDLPANWFASEKAPVGNTKKAGYFRYVGGKYGTFHAVPTSQPGFNLIDLSQTTGINKPTIQIQGSSVPRIVSTDTAEAIIGQHFSYHIVTAFVDAGEKLTYSATGLPAGFVIDRKTGVISGAPKPGMQTKEPILVALRVNDGSETGSATLRLHISFDGNPFFTVEGSNEPVYPGSASPVTGLADRPLSFALYYLGRQAGQLAGVQATTTPGNEASWQYLETGTDGYMTFDVSTGSYVLNSINYPSKSSVYFRAVVKVPARTASDGSEKFVASSNVVGPFDLASSTPRVGQTLLSIIRNGLRADFDFRAALISSRSDTKIRVQRSTEPGVEGSWVFAVAGEMQQDKPKSFSSTTNDMQEGTGVYFRAIASSPGAAGSLSNIIGPYTITAVTPPTIDSVGVGGGATGSGATFEDPAVIKLAANGTAKFTITIGASSPSSIEKLSVLFNGTVVDSKRPGTKNASIVYEGSVTSDDIGDHVIEGFAVDTQGATSRAGTFPFYLRIAPAAPAAAAMRDGSGDAAAAATGGKVFTVVNSGGFWHEPSTWRDSEGNPGVPRTNDFAVIGAATVRTSDPGNHGYFVKAFSINGGRVVGPSFISVVFGTATIAGGSFDKGMSLISGHGSTCTLINAEDFTFTGETGLTGHFHNGGTVNVHGAAGVTGTSRFINTGTVNFQQPLLTPAQLAAGLSPDPRVFAGKYVEQSGIINTQLLISQDGSSLIGNDGSSLVAASGGSLISQDGSSLIGNDGSGLIGNDGSSLVTDNGSGLLANDGATLIGNDGSSLIGNDGSGLIGQDGSGIVAGGAGNLTEGMMASADRDGSATTAATSPSGFVQTAGETDLTGIWIRGRVNLNGGVLSGSGLIAGSLTNSGGFVLPGNSPGALTVTGNFVQRAGGTLVIDAAGGEPHQFDQLRAGGTATLGGNLVVQTIGGYEPLPGDPFNPIGYKSRSGSFASVTGNVEVDFNATGMLATLKPNAPNPPKPKLLNISTRMRVEPGDNALIGGFIVTGTAPKKVLLRAIGPSLPVGDKLADPTLELVKPGGSKVFNDNWRDTQANAIIATTIPPSNELESAIVATLQPGFYTAVVRGLVGGQPIGTGVGLVEVYDLDQDAASTLANISTRGLVQTGDNVMIGGLIIDGTVPAKTLVRAIGPSLRNQGVAGALQDPELQLVDRNGNTISNDDWRATQEAEVLATTVPPPNNREAAIVATLVPGVYTAVVRGKDNSTGIALVEVFNLQ